MKNHCFEIKVEKETPEGFVDLQRKVTLYIDDGFTMETILTFKRDFSKALSEARKAVHTNSRIEARLMISTYDGWQDDTRELTQKSFDCWEYKGYLQDTGGLYLPADTEYTDPTLDLWIDYSNPIESIMDK